MGGGEQKMIVTHLTEDSITVIRHADGSIHLYTYNDEESITIEMDERQFLEMYRCATDILQIIINGKWMNKSE